MKRIGTIPRISGLQGFFLVLVSLVGVIFAGCGGKVSTDEGASTGDSGPQLWPAEQGLTAHRPGCDILAAEAVPGGQFTFALTDSVDPGRAPVPHNPSERLVFAQLYETLVNVDCDGTVRPGLAEQWTCTEDSTVWVFTLRDQARLWDGTRITPGEVKEAWTLNQDCPRTRAAASPWSWFNARSRTITILDARRLAIRLPEPQAAFPLLLAHPATAVALPRPGWTWPVGSGPCRLRATTPAPVPLLECLPNQHHPFSPIWTSLTFAVYPESDPRDLAGNDAQLMTVRNLNNLDFYREAPGFSVHPLPWDRLYLLVVDPDKNPYESRVWTEAAGQLDPARDLTSIAARPWSDIIFPSGSRVDCAQLAGPVALGSGALRSWDLAGLQLSGDVLTFNAEDAGAAEIANRLGALVAEPVRVVGLPADAATFALDWQMTGAHILRLDQVFPTRCLQMAALLGKAAWIQQKGLGDLAAQPADAQDADRANSLVDAEDRYRREPPDPNSALREFVHPVALSRPWLVTRGNLAGLRLAYDGTVLLDGLGYSAAGADLP